TPAGRQRPGPHTPPEQGGRPGVIPPELTGQPEPCKSAQHPSRLHGHGPAPGLPAFSPQTFPSAQTLVSEPPWGTTHLQNSWVKLWRFPLKSAFYNFTIQEIPRILESLHRYHGPHVAIN
uniref:Uncharacterized protein n=1 Tax=Mustela putorius furo TaxID=9669 RepID=M3Z3H8_MUSPF